MAKREDLSNITDEQVANLFYDRSPLKGKNTYLYLGGLKGDGHPDMYLVGDSTGTDGSEWRIKYEFDPFLYNSKKGFNINRLAKSKTGGRYEERDFYHKYPDGYRVIIGDPDNQGIFNYDNNRENYYDLFYNNRGDKDVLNYYYTGKKPNFYRFGGRLNYLNYFK